MSLKFQGKCYMVHPFLAAIYLPFPEPHCFVSSGAPAWPEQFPRQASFTVSQFLSLSQHFPRYQLVDTTYQDSLPIFDFIFSKSEVRKLATCSSSPYCNAAVFASTRKPPSLLSTEPSYNMRNNCHHSCTKIRTLAAPNEGFPQLLSCFK
jgi:hypothetical protein